MDELKGRVALVTGASRGIGAAIAERFAAEGAAVGIVARTTEPGDHRFGGSLAETVAAIEATGGTAVAVAHDLAATDADFEGVVTQVRDQLGAVDILVNNAGVAIPAGFDATTEKQWNLCARVNTWAPWCLTRAVLPAMRDAGRGWVVNLTSFMGDADRAMAMPGDEAVGVAYGTAKAALNHWTRVVGADAARRGIALNAVYPHVAVATAAAAALDEFDPRTAEPVETLVEAVLALASCAADEQGGRIVSSLSLLTELGRPVRDLRGRELVPGWQPADIARIRTQGGTE